MEKFLKAVRAQDIQMGLSQITSGLSNLHMKNVKLIGAASQVCSLIESRQVVSNFDSLIVAAGEIGIDDNLLDKCLDELQELEFVRVIKNGQVTKKIEVTIPQLKNRFEILGDRFESLNPSDVENAAIKILDDLAELPMNCADIIYKHGIDTNTSQIIIDIGKGAGFLDKYRSPADSKEIWFAPIYWDENPEKMIQLSDKYTSNEVLKAIKSIRSNQGKPVELLNNPILIEAVANGCLPSPKVSSTSGEKQFLFTPIRGVEVYEKNLLNKARAIVACMRYGETFGNITKIRMPDVFLRSLLDKRYIRPHSETPTQYAILVKLGVGFTDPEIGTNKHFFRLLETPENLKAIELAIQMVTVGVVNRQDNEVEMAKGLLIPGTYYNDTSMRIRIKNEIKYSTNNVIRINDLIRGVSSDIA